jgi:hypothetical protein
MDAKKSRIFGFTLAGCAWLAGTLCAVAIGFALNRPMKLPGVAWLRESHAVSADPALDVVFEAPAFGDVLDVAPAWIFGDAARKGARPAEPEPTTLARDINDMRCGDWRELQAGHGRVQICE